MQLKLEHEKIIGQLKKNHEQEMTSCGRDARVRPGDLQSSVDEVHSCDPHKRRQPRRS